MLITFYVPMLAVILYYIHSPGESSQSHGSTCLHSERKLRFKHVLYMCRIQQVIANESLSKVCAWDEMCVIRISMRMNVMKNTLMHKGERRCTQVLGFCMIRLTYVLYQNIYSDSKTYNKIKCVDSLHEADLKFPFE